MGTPAQFSETNVGNSVAAYLAARLLADGYLVYWYETDAVETPDGWYPDYTAQDDAYALDSAFAARLAAAKGLVTLRGGLTANPSFVTRPTRSGAIDEASQVPVPAFAVEVGPAVPLGNVELGTASVKWRVRHLLLFGFARTAAEQSALADRLGQWLDADAPVPVADHDAGTVAPVGDVRVAAPAADKYTVVAGPEAATFVVELNARLEYEA